MAGLRPEPGCQLEATGCTRTGCAGSSSRDGRRSVPSGAKSTTYRTKGLFVEQENLDSSAAGHRPAASRQVR